MKIYSSSSSLVLALVCLGPSVHGFTFHNQWGQRIAGFKNTVIFNSPSSSSEISTASTVSPTTTDHSPHRPPLSPEFDAARDATIQVLSKAVESDRLKALLTHFTEEYFSACYAANAAGVEEVTPKYTAKSMMNALQYGMQFGVGENKYKFGVSHVALRGKNTEVENGNTIDFYKFGCDFFRPAMDLQHSIVYGQAHLQKAQEQLQRGENVIFLANHQSEADPQVVSCLFEKAGFTQMAEEMYCVAGHKVTTDALAVPFSMGRNLICIHSKKHIDADPETKPLKSKQNLQAMSSMLELLKRGGTAIWVAPSGGRDRRSLDGSRHVPIAPFDPKTVDMFRLMGTKSKKNTHFYAMSMVSYELCPPPDYVEAGTGEQRNVRFVPVGITISDELNNQNGSDGREEFTDTTFNICKDGYDKLLQGLKDGKAGVF